MAVQSSEPGDQNAPETENTYVRFEVGDKVICPVDYDNQVLTVAEIIPINNPTDEKLALHNQWVIAELNGQRIPSKSGYHFKKVS